MAKTALEILALDFLLGHIKHACAHKSEYQIMEGIHIIDETIPIAVLNVLNESNQLKVRWSSTYTMYFKRNTSFQFISSFHNAEKGGHEIIRKDDVCFSRHYSSRCDEAAPKNIVSQKDVAYGDLVPIDAHLTVCLLKRSLKTCLPICCFLGWNSERSNLDPVPPSLDLLKTNPRTHTVSGHNEKPAILLSEVAPNCRWSFWLWPWPWPLSGLVYR